MLPTNLLQLGATSMTPPLKGMATNLSPHLTPATVRIFLSRTTLYVLSSETRSNDEPFSQSDTPHIKNLPQNSLGVRKRLGNSQRELAYSSKALIRQLLCNTVNLLVRLRWTLTRCCSFTIKPPSWAYRSTSTWAGMAMQRCPSLLNRLEAWARNSRMRVAIFTPIVDEPRP